MGGNVDCGYHSVETVGAGVRPVRPVLLGGRRWFKGMRFHSILRFHSEIPFRDLFRDSIPRSYSKIPRRSRCWWRSRCATGTASPSCAATTRAGRSRKCEWRGGAGREGGRARECEGWGGRESVSSGECVSVRGGTARV